jgi:hypothetical protein
MKVFALAFSCAGGKRKKQILVGVQGATPPPQLVVMLCGSLKRSSITTA